MKPSKLHQVALQEGLNILHGQQRNAYTNAAARKLPNFRGTLIDAGGFEPSQMFFLPCLRQWHDAPGTIGQSYSRLARSKLGGSPL